MLGNYKIDTEIDFFFPSCSLQFKIPNGYIFIMNKSFENMYDVIIIINSFTVSSRTTTNRRKAVRNPLTSQHYRNEGFKGAIGPPLF